MRRFHDRALGAALGVLALLSAGCRAAMAPTIDPSAAAGFYVLDGAVARGPSAGSFVLTSSGQATRRVQYSLSDGGPGEFTARGSFRLVRPDSIIFALRDDNSPDATRVWPVAGVRIGTRFTIRYPHAADGEAVETYRRVDP